MTADVGGEPLKAPGGVQVSISFAHMAPDSGQKAGPMVEGQNQTNQTIDVDWKEEQV